MKRQYSKKYITLPALLSVLFIWFTSCQKIFLAPKGKKDPVSVFDEFYTVMNEKFVLSEKSAFNYTPLMDSMRQVLLANPTNEQLSALFKELFHKICDGHSEMQVETSAGVAIHSYDYEKGYKKNIDEKLLLEKYLNGNTERMTVVKKQNELGKPSVALAFGVLPANPNLGYLYIPKFDIQLQEKDFDDIFKSFKDAKGLIIDLRGNSGGYINMATEFASRFYEADRKLAFTG